MFLLLLSCHTEFTPIGVQVAAHSEDGSPTELLLSDTAGFPACSKRNDGGVHLLDTSGAVLWSLGAGPGFRGPHTAMFSPDRLTMLVTDTCNERVRVFHYPSGAEAWDSGQDCPELVVSHPNFASFTGDGLDDTILVSALTGERVFELDPSLCGNGIEGDEVVWQYGARDDPLRYPHSAVLEPRTGHILITDSGGPWEDAGRVIEVRPTGRHDGEIVWSYPSEPCADGPCPGQSWLRGAELTCDDADCTTGSVLITDRDETIRVRRDLAAWSAGAPIVPDLHLRYAERYAYSAQYLPVWDGDDNAGQGWLLVSHHGLRADQGWLRVVAADASDAMAPVWELDRLP